MQRSAFKDLTKLPKEVPVLVLWFGSGTSETDVTETLGISSITDWMCYVQLCSDQTLEGLKEGFVELSKMMRAKEPQMQYLIINRKLNNIKDDESSSKNERTSMQYLIINRKLNNVGTRWKHFAISKVCEHHNPLTKSLPK